MTQQYCNTAADRVVPLIAKGIRRIIGTDTYPGRQSDALLQVFSVAPLIAAELRQYLGFWPSPA